MIRMSKEWPEEGDLIIGAAHSVLGYGAFAKLNNMKEKKLLCIFLKFLQLGKNIRDYVKEN